VQLTDKQRQRAIQLTGHRGQREPVCSRISATSLSRKRDCLRARRDRRHH
jgi:hypothetical protein